MKYLLVGVNAKYIHSNLAIRCLRSYASKYTTVTPDLRDYTINMPVSDIVRDIYSQSPDFLAFSVYIWNVDIIMQLVSDIRILLPDVIIYLGGPEVSFDSVKILTDHPEVDGIMLGEGEQTLSELISYFEKLSSQSKITPSQTDAAANHSISSLSAINGLCYRNKDIIVTTAPRQTINLSDLPFPYDNLSDLDNKIIYYETSRGCPFHCSYCLSSVDKTLRFRDMDLVKKELQIFLDAKVPQVKFVDRTFNIDHNRSIAMLKYLEENDNGITNFHFEIAGDILTDEEISIINSLRPGLIQLEIGVQSTNPCTLETINRRTDLARLETNVQKLLAAGNIHLHLDLIAGLPYENLESFIHSFNQVYAMNSHELQLGFLKVLKGAPINELTSEQSILHSQRAPYEVMSTKYLSYRDICELKQVEEMLEIYHNSCQFTNSEKMLLEGETSPYNMYHNLALFYESKNQPVIQCKRAVRYELLLEYFIEKCNPDTELLQHFKIMLTIDYYSRERAKARPSFALPIESHKSQIRTIEKQLSLNNPDGLYHIEPTGVVGEYLVFDYNDRSPITGNVSTFTVFPDQM